MVQEEDLLTNCEYDSIDILWINNSKDFGFGNVNWIANDAQYFHWNAQTEWKYKENISEFDVSWDIVHNAFFMFPTVNL